MKQFVGFPNGRLRVTPLPDLFFSELLAQIDDLAELKITLHMLWRMAHAAAPLCLSLSQLRADTTLRQSLGARALDEALQRAVQRCTLLELRTRNKAGQSERWYFVNNEAGRRDAARVRAGQLRLSRGATLTPAPDDAQPPNIFTLYEQHIGLLTPLIAEQVQAAAQTYPTAWLNEAFAIAVKNDKRHWRYVEAILQRWAREGKDAVRAHTTRRSGRTPSLKRKA